MNDQEKLEKALRAAREVLKWSEDDEQEYINILHNHLANLIECVERARTKESDRG